MSLLHLLSGFPAAGGGGGSWTLADLTTPPALWSRPEDILNDANATWGDSGGVLAWSQTTATYQPTYPSAVLNGYDVARFDGSNDVLDLNQKSFFRNKTVGWFVCVFKRASLDVTSTSRTLFYCSTNSNGTPRFGCYAGGGTGNGNKLQLWTRRLNADGANILVVPDPTADTDYHIALFIHDWANAESQIWVDGENVTGVVSKGTAGSTQDTDSVQVLMLGALRGGGAPVFSLNGDIAEFAADNVAIPSGSEIDKVFGYLAHKYALTSVLPVGHPYKSSAP